jgi:hypothetical protein
MFNGDLGFNPFDKANNVFANGFVQNRQKFLDSFNTSDHLERLFIFNGDPRKKISSMNHTYDILEMLRANLNNHSDAYFYVNGTRKIYDIKSFTCAFCDMDAGRDDKGSYFKPSVVVEKKKEFLDKINKFPVEPSWVVDTRNGYQCYWIFDVDSRKMIGSNKTFWDGLQKKLVNYFGGDPRAIKANQIYRVPYTWWRKEWEKKVPYFTSIISGSTGRLISVKDLQSALDGQPATLQIVREKCSTEWYKGYAKAYKQSDVTGVAVAANVATDIMNQMRLIDTNESPATYKYKEDINGLYGYVRGIDTQKETKIYDVSKPLVSGDYLNNGLLDDRMSVGNKHLGLDSQHSQHSQQTQLLKTVVEYLNQASTALYFSNNRFLASSAKDLASKISDKFCIG